MKEPDKLYTESVVIEFEALYDIPYGIIRTIRDFYYDPEVFKENWMKADVYNLRCLLYDRKIYDPILPALIDKDKSLSKDLYNQLMMNKIEFNKIMSRSPKTAMYDVVDNLGSISEEHANITTVTILCKDKISYDWVKKNSKLKSVRFVLVDEFKHNLNQYSLIILEQYEDIVKYTTARNERIEGRTIWIPDYQYNMDLEDPSRPSTEISIFVAEFNKVATYTPYRNFIKPVG